MGKKVKKMAYHREKRCVTCGAVFIANAPNRKYCEQCAKNAAYERERARKKAGKEDQAWHMCDRPEVIEICLKCTKLSCNHGDCVEIAAAIRNSTKRKAGVSDENSESLRLW